EQVLALVRAGNPVGALRLLSGRQGPGITVMEVVLGVLFLTLVVVAVRSATAISGERERRTWDGLLITRLTSQELVRGQGRGIVGACVPYLVAAALPVLALAALDGFITLAVTLSALVLTWRATSLVAAIGLDASARFAGTWRGIVVTLFVSTAHAAVYVL